MSWLKDQTRGNNTSVDIHSKIKQNGVSCNTVSVKKKQFQCHHISFLLLLPLPDTSRLEPLFPPFIVLHPSLSLLCPVPPPPPMGDAFPMLSLSDAAPEGIRSERVASFVSSSAKSLLLSLIRPRQNESAAYRAWGWTGAAPVRGAVSMLGLGRGLGANDHVNQESTYFC